MRALFGARSERDSRGRCAWLSRREVAWAVLNANAKLKIERAEFVGWDARTARARHAEQARREHARRQTCAWASADTSAVAIPHTTRTAPSGSVGDEPGRGRLGLEC